MQRLFERFTLRSSLLLDAAVCAAAGLLMFAAAGPLGDLLDLPTTLLRVAGVILIPYVALLAIIASRSSIAPAAAWTVIGTNLLWTAASFILLLSGQTDPNALGIAFVIFQAIIVALFAELQFTALDRRRTPDTMHIART